MWQDTDTFRRDYPVQFSIDRSSPVPAYYQIQLDLSDRIQRGEWNDRKQLPSESTLAEQYAQAAYQYVKKKGSSTMSDSKSTENSRMILALTSIGKDPSDVAGYDLLEPLADLDYVKSQGINGPIFAQIALDSHDYEIPKAVAGKTQTTREALIDAILAAR